ncbi:hypothetical protein [Bacteroides sp.]|uniref:hypothetical protein n=1 Tax=Bacteroides sp. TaxID=29523 RepID=UPI002605ACB3|nr:hypothetical protein [Bacteroides sp.]MDD3038428.1 hypothetical protein [Bacteroides sp.]
MSKLTYKASYYALYAMFAIILIVMVLFFLGGSATGDSAIPGIDPEMWQPAQTDALLYLMYVLFGVAIATTIVAAIFQFGAALKDNPTNAVRSLLGLILLVVILFIAWAIGDGTPMYIRGYDGADNVPFWLKITDMFLYSIYILLFVTVVAIIVSGIRKKIS